MTRHILRAILASFALLCSAQPAAAQSTVYVTGTGFADIKRFSTTEGTYYYSGDDDFSLNGTEAGGGLRIGTYLHPRWSLELAVDAGGKTEGSSSPYAVILADAPASLRIPELKESTQFLAISTAVGFHPPAHGRVRLGYLVGFSFVKGTYKSDYPDYALPVLSWSASSSSSTSPPRLSPLIFPPPVFTTRTITVVDYTSAAVVGFEAGIDLTRRLAVVPEIRALAFSSANNGPGVFLIRPGIGLRWSF